MRRFVVLLALGAMLLTGARALGDALPHVEARGEGDVPMVLIHSVYTDWRVWESFMERNADRYRMIAVRLPGCGGSEPLAQPEDFELGQTPWTDRVVDAIASEMRERGMRGATAVGHAYGGAVAMRLAIEHPDLVSSVVSIEAMPAYPLNRNGFQPTREERLEQVRKGFLAQQQEVGDMDWAIRMRNLGVRQATEPSVQRFLSDLYSLIPKDVWRQYYSEYYTMDLRDALDASGARALGITVINTGLIRSFSTRVMIEELIHRGWDAVERASVVFFDDTLHMAMLERPDALDRVVWDFVNGAAPSGYAVWGPDPLDAPPVRRTWGDGEPAGGGADG